MPPQTQPGLGSPPLHTLLLGGDPAGLETPGRKRPKEEPFTPAELLSGGRAGLLRGDVELETPGRTRPKEGPFGITELKESHKFLRGAGALVPGVGWLSTIVPILDALPGGRLDKTHKASTKDAVAATRTRKERSAARAKSRSGPPRGDRRL
jgi:hypothetical protein